MKKSSSCYLILNILTQICKTRHALPCILHLIKKSFLCSENGSRQTLLHVAAAGGHLKIIKMLNDSQADINAKDAHNKTALHLAARNGRVDAVRGLMQITYDQAKAKTENADAKENKNASDADESEEEDTKSYLDEDSLSSHR